MTGQQKPSRSERLLFHFSDAIPCSELGRGLRPLTGCRVFLYLCSMEESGMSAEMREGDDGEWRDRMAGG